MAFSSSSRPSDETKSKLAPTEYTLPIRQDVFVRSPVLIGIETIEKSTIARRAAFYQASKLIHSYDEWNYYCHFGIQMYEDPIPFINLVAKETTPEKLLRQWQYYLHLRKHDTEISPLLLSQLVEMKTYIGANHPGLYDAVVDGPAAPLSPPKARRDPTAAIVEEFNPTPAEMVRGAAADELRRAEAELRDAEDYTTEAEAALQCAEAAVTADTQPADYPVEDEVVHCADAEPTSEVVDEAVDVSVKVQATAVSTASPIKSLPIGASSMAPLNDGHLRFDVTWSPPNYDALQKDSSAFYIDVTDMVYNFITKTGVSLVQWQSDLCCPDIQQISTVAIKDYLSTTIGNDRNRKIFFFSFRTSWPEHGVVQLLRRGDVQAMKRDWSIQIDTSNIAAKSGETVVAGDLLMISMDHLQRKNFDQYIRRDQLPANTPHFDLKVRHRCPLKTKTKIAIVKCGKNDLAALSLIFNRVFDGEQNVEVFIPKLGITKCKLTKSQITSIYDQHRSRVRDLKAIPVPRLKNVDMERTEYHADGSTTLRSLRQWARQLHDDNDLGLEATADNGTGETVLLVPSKSVGTATAQLKLYLLSLDPPLPLNDEKLYIEAMGSATTAEENELVRNILRLLNRGAPKAAPPPKANAWHKATPVPVETEPATTPKTATVTVKVKEEPGLTDIAAIEPMIHPVIEKIQAKYGSENDSHSCPPPLRAIIAAIFLKNREITPGYDSPARPTMQPSVSEDLDRLYAEVVAYEHLQAAQATPLPPIVTSVERVPLLKPAPTTATVTSDEDSPNAEHRSSARKRDRTFTPPSLQKRQSTEQGSPMKAETLGHNDSC